jgi:hypothetical protein
MDQLILFMALAKGTSKVFCAKSLPRANFSDSGAERFIDHFAAFGNGDSLYEVARWCRFRRRAKRRWLKNGQL